MPARSYIVIDARDNVATAVRELPVGEVLCIETPFCAGVLTLIDPIPFGHKFALRLIAAGRPVIKYGETTGLTTDDIQPGRHVHVHNVEGIKGRGDKARGERCDRTTTAPPDLTCEVS